MLYGFLKLLFRITIRVFFRKVHIHHRERVPDGPLILCANHPSAFMDPIIIAALIHRRVYFLAKAEAFRTRMGKWLLPKVNIVPIYRAQDDPSQMHKNEETFVKCYEHLAKGGAILIFPEGTSLTERKLRKIKTGAARIALGAEASNDYQLGVKLLPVGMNYANPHKFRQDLYIHIGEPIPAADYAEQYRTEGFAAAEAMTERLRQGLEQGIIAVEDEDTDKLVAQIERLYKAKLMSDLGVEEDDQSREFELTKRIVETVNYYKETDPERVERVRGEVNTYFRYLNALGLDDRLVANAGMRTGWLKFFGIAFLLVLGFPLWLVGTILNVVPFQLPIALANKIAKHPNFYGSVVMASGALLFLFWYLGLILSCWFLTHRALWTLGLAVLLPVSGIFALYYFRRVKRISRHWFLRSLFSSRASLRDELRRQRTNIIADFDASAAEFAEKFGSIRERWN